MADYSIDIRNLVKHHDGIPVVDHLSLQVPRGEFFSILGPSGSGKTTILRLLAGLDEPDGGDILIEGQPMRAVPSHRRPVNMVFQSYALFPHLTVSDNIAFGLEMRGLPESDVQARVRRAIEMVKLAGKERRVPSKLSGGEQQRVALARALVNQPAVLLLDEPLGALDQQLRQEMQVELKAIQKQVGLTFLLVTHHQEEALTMSDRLAVMAHGRLLQVGSPQEVYETPATSFVASFIGTANQLSIRLENDHEAAATFSAIDLPAQPLLRARSQPGAGAGGVATLVLRPEQLTLSQESGEAGSDNELVARIEKTIYTGNEVQYLLRLAEGVFWKARTPNSGGDEKSFHEGETVFVRWRLDEGRVLST